MRSISLICASIALSLLFGVSSLSARERATAEQAKAMLERAIADVTADEKSALAKFNAAEGVYKHDDLYVFCFDANSGTITADPTNVGRDIKSTKDSTGKAFGNEMFATAKEGIISEIDYMWPRLNTTGPVEKHSYYTRVGDEVCGVGYYYPPWSLLTWR
jgi:hypothetical protein